MRENRSTPAGEHRPVLLEEVLAVLEPRPGEVVVDCTLGFGGHAGELLQRIGPEGRLIGFDLDQENLETVRERLTSIGHPFTLHHSNFAGIMRAIGQENLEGCDMVLADLGMSSMQVDDARRGFSYMREGPLDMRMDGSRGRTAADLLNTLPEDELASAFLEIGDEPQASEIAAAIVAIRGEMPLRTTKQLAKLIQEAAPVKVNPYPLPGEPKAWQQKIRPVARVFQALRILVNRELANLKELLRVLPTCLRPGGRVALISFHSGEDRLVKAAFKEGLRNGTYTATSDDPIRATYEERGMNPRSRSAKLRWAKRAEY
ncbi:MAG: 16S rRNA (cytosine(1402)-N(4))-methyltransferase RsmH [Planctomycetes bacterium]|nr:16S rRNA (cytosine(1402)-N(4))-methyltransferase RsmH [Planctomycetota bacterium]